MSATFVRVENSCLSGSNFTFKVFVKPSGLPFFDGENRQSDSARTQEETESSHESAALANNLEFEPFIFTGLFPRDY